jgi:hypothetical protein
MQIDLAAVSFIDDNGKLLLAEMCRQGVRFITTGLLIRAIINEIEENLHGKHEISEKL